MQPGCKPYWISRNTVLSICIRTLPAYVGISNEEARQRCIQLCQVLRASICIFVCTGSYPITCPQNKIYLPIIASSRILWMCYSRSSPRSPSLLWMTRVQSPEHRVHTKPFPGRPRGLGKMYSRLHVLP